MKSISLGGKPMFFLGRGLVIDLGWQTLVVVCRHLPKESDRSWWSMWQLVF